MNVRQRIQRDPSVEHIVSQRTAILTLCVPLGCEVYTMTKFQETTADCGVGGNRRF
jgi:uncharacterized membrane protein YhfC